MLTIFGLLLMALAGLLQTTLLPVLVPQIAHLDVRPDLLVLFIVAIALADGLREATLWAFAGGLFLDLLSGLPLGTNALCLLLVAVLAYLGGRNPFQVRLVTPLGMVFLCTIFYYVMLLGLRTLIGHHFSWGAALAGVVLPTALLNVALMPLVYSFVLWIADRFRQRLPEEWQ